MKNENVIQAPQLRYNETTSLDIDEKLSLGILTIGWGKWFDVVQKVWKFKLWTTLKFLKPSRFCVVISGCGSWNTKRYEHQNKFE